MEWLPASIFSVVVGIIAFFLKKTYANFETKMSEMRKDSDEKMSCLREDFQQESKTIREDFRISMNSQIKRLTSWRYHPGHALQVHPQGGLHPQHVGGGQETWIGFWRRWGKGKRMNKDIEIIQKVKIRGIS